MDTNPPIRKIRPPVSNPVAEAFRNRRKEGLHAVQLAKAGGVPIAAGTDDGSPKLPHGVLVYELELLVRAGLSP